MNQFTMSMAHNTKTFVFLIPSCGLIWYIDLLVSIIVSIKFHILLWTPMITCICEPRLLNRPRRDCKDWWIDVEEIAKSSRNDQPSHYIPCKVKPRLKYD